MTCQFCTEKLTWLVPSQKTVSRTGALALSIASAGVSAFLAKRIYDTSLQVFRELIPCPGIELTCMGLVGIGSAYLSMKNGRFALGICQSNRVVPRTLRPVNQTSDGTQVMPEVTAFATGEFVGPSRGASQ